MSSAVFSIATPSHACPANIGPRARASRIDPAANAAHATSVAADHFLMPVFTTPRKAAWRVPSSGARHAKAPLVFVRAGSHQVRLRGWCKQRKRGREDEEKRKGEEKRKRSAKPSEQESSRKRIAQALEANRAPGRGGPEYSLFVVRGSAAHGASRDERSHEQRACHPEVVHETVIISGTSASRRRVRGSASFPRVCQRGQRGGGTSQFFRPAGALPSELRRALCRRCVDMSSTANKVRASQTRP